MAGSLPAGTTAPRGLPAPEQIRWPLVPARDLFELRYGRALIEADRRPGTVAVYGTNGQCGWHDKALFKGPGVILGRKGQGPLGVEWSERDYWVIDTAYALEPIRSDVDLKYAYYLISFVGLNHLKDGTSNPTLSRDTFGAQALPLPPLSDQRAIAYILGTLDDKIELNRRMNEILEAATRTLFKSWFVNFDPVRARTEGRECGLPDSLAEFFPERFVEGELGEIPERWEIVALGDQFDAVKGVSYKGSGLSKSGMPLHNLNSIYEGGGYKYEGIKYYDGEYAERHVVEPGDVIVANTEQGHDRLLIGYAAIVPRTFGDHGIASHHIYRLRPKRGAVLTAAFLCYLLNSPQMHDVVSGYANGTTVNMLPIDGVQKPHICVPPRPLVMAFDRLAGHIALRREEMIVESRTLVALRDSLLPKLIFGELRIKDAESVIGRAV